MRVIAEQATWSESREMAVYRPGQKVELKQRPGIIDTIVAYDPMMVPPTILANDPQPRYPEELILISQPSHGFDWFSHRVKVAPSPQMSIGHR